jgi:hypothetical protein
MKNSVLLSRRKLLILASSSIVSVPFAALADGIFPDIHVVKNPQCGCCDAWIQTLKDKDFIVTTENRSGTLLTEFKAQSGIPKNMMSCHTAIIDGYFIEGHVHASDIKRLIADRPDALGLAVPAMPYGSPGMGPEDGREAYDVYIISTDGTADVFQHYPQAGMSV